jgi:hypothetical protein
MYVCMCVLECVWCNVPVCVCVCVCVCAYTSSAFSSVSKMLLDMSAASSASVIDMGMFRIISDWKSDNGIKTLKLCLDVIANSESVVLSLLSIHASFVRVCHFK